MIEDMDYNGPYGPYRQQPPLQPPPMNVSSPVRGALSPQRVNSLVAQSGSNPWSPAPLDATHYQRTAVDPLLQSQTFTKSSEVWQNNNPYIKTSDTWLTHNPSIKSPEVSLNNNPYIRSPDAWLTNNPNIKSSDAWSTNNPQIRSSELWLQSNTLTKPPESTLTSNNSSNAQMIKSSNKTLGSITDRCSPSCKLGLLGFIIGFLAVGIALAVVLVLWLRQ